MTRPSRQRAGCLACGASELVDGDEEAAAWRKHHLAFCRMRDGLASEHSGVGDGTGPAKKSPGEEASSEKATSGGEP